MLLIPLRSRRRTCLLAFHGGYKHFYNISNPARNNNKRHHPQSILSITSTQAVACFLTVLACFVITHTVICKVSEHLQKTPAGTEHEAMLGAGELFTSALIVCHSTCSEKLWIISRNCVLTIQCALRESFSRKVLLLLHSFPPFLVLIRWVFLSCLRPYMTLYYHIGAEWVIYCNLFPSHTQCLLLGLSFSTKYPRPNEPLVFMSTVFCVLPPPLFPWPCPSMLHFAFGFLHFLSPSVWWPYFFCITARSNPVVMYDFLKKNDNKW